MVDSCNLLKQLKKADVTNIQLFGGLWGHVGLQMASKDTFGLIVKLSDLNHLCNNASLAASICKGLRILRPRIREAYTGGKFAGDICEVALARCVNVKKGCSRIWEREILMVSLTLKLDFPREDRYGRLTCVASPQVKISFECYCLACFLSLGHFASAYTAFSPNIILNSDNKG